MAVPTAITDMSATAASNSPSGSESIGSSLDDYLRAYQAVLYAWGHHKGADVASATAMTVGSVAGFMHDITGTTEIQGLDTIAAGIHKVLQFDGALTLVHNATSFILPGGANITTAAGDRAWFISEGSGNWRCLMYTTAATGAYVTASTTSAKGVIEIATQAEMETGTSTSLAVTPGTQAFHPGHPKFWALVTVSASTPTVYSGSYNVTSVADDGVGLMTLTIGTDFSSTSWCCVFSVEVAEDSGAPLTFVTHRIVPSSRTATAIQLIVTQWDLDGHTSATIDPSSWNIVGFGDQ